MPRRFAIAAGPNSALGGLICAASPAASAVWLWRQPGNRRPADVVAAANIGERFPTPVAALDRLAPLVRRQLGRTAHFLPPGYGPRPTFAGAGADQVAFELRQPPEHGE